MSGKRKFIDEESSEGDQYAGLENDDSDELDGETIIFASGPSQDRTSKVPKAERNEEEWRACVYPGRDLSFYSVSESGRVYSHRAGRLLKEQKGVTGYYGLSLYSDRIDEPRERHWYVIHRLVAFAFYGSPRDAAKLHVDHIVSKENNHYKALRWCTPSQNMKAMRSNAIPAADNGSGEPARKMDRDNIVITHDSGSDGTMVYKQHPYFTKYEVSSSGRVRNRETKHVRTLRTDRGYPTIQLRHNGKCYTRFVHRLVAELYCEKPDGASVVDHKDSNKKNCDSTNLHWITPLENAERAQAKEVYQFDKSGRLLATFPSTVRAAKAVNGSAGSISRVCNGIQPFHKDFIWSYTKNVNPENHVTTIFEKTVHQFDRQGNLIQSHASIREAADSVGASPNTVSDVCNKKIKTCKGFVWSFSPTINANDHIPIDSKKKVYQFTLKGELIAKYSSINEASRQTHNSPAGIRKSCNGKQNTCGGHLWSFSAELERSVGTGEVGI